MAGSYGPASRCANRGGGYRGTVGPVPDSIIEAFASQFASGRRGFSLREISDYFSSYEKNVPSPPSGSMLPTKPDFFHTCLLTLSPLDQRMALLELCDSPPKSSHPMPDKATRLTLRELLFQVHGVSPIRKGFSEVSLRGVREHWWKCASRLPTQPAAAITSGRALLESTCKTILSEMGETPDSSGDLPKLFRQTADVLGISRVGSGEQGKWQVITGLASIVSGIAGLSNVAGDRHGLAGAREIRELHLAELAVYASGVLAIFLARIFVLRNLGGKSH